MSVIISAGKGVQKPNKAEKAEKPAEKPSTKKATTKK